MPVNQSRKILVAEDNKVLGDVLRFNLERAGFQVTAVRNGDAAANLVSAEPFDLLFTDIEMPGINGLELCRLVREEFCNSELPIVICSARGLEIDDLAIRAKYAIAEIVFKPFSVRELVALANRLLTPTAPSPSRPVDVSLAD